MLLQCVSDFGIISNQRSLLTLRIVMNKRATPVWVGTGWTGTVWTAAVWTAAAVAFVAYPALRPYADETGLPGLAAMATDRWLVAHLLGMLGFMLLAPALRSVAERTPAQPRSARLLAPLAWAGAILVLPYYGGEAFGLHAIGAYASAQHDPGLIQVVNGFRYQPVAITMFGMGLALVATAGVLLVLGTRTAGRLVRFAGLLTGLGLALYLPQFFGTPTVRVAHGVVLGLGCLIFAFVTIRDRHAGGPPPVGESTDRAGRGLVHEPATSH
jgi:hypothetical protein